MYNKTMGCLGGLAHGFKTINHVHGFKTWFAHGFYAHGFKSWFMVLKPCARLPKQPIVLFYMV